MSERPLRDFELKIVSELMKNSRRSDRELAKAVGLSQPSVSRIIRKLEKNGFVQEYTMVPNFLKLGYMILAITVVKLKQSLDSAEIEGAKKIIRDTLKITPFEIVMLERGLGLNSDGVIISYHKDYGAHLKFIELLKSVNLLVVEEIRSFRVDLQDDVRFLPLTFSLVAQCVGRIDELKE